MNPPLYSESIPKGLHDKIKNFVARLPASVQLQLATATPEQAAQILYKLGAFSGGGLSDAPPGLGWINFVIQAAFALYGAKAQADAKKKAEAKQREAERQAREQAAAEAAAAAAAQAAALQAQKAQAAASGGAGGAMSWRSPLVLGGAAVVGLGLLWAITRGRK